ncbi:MAG: hypothetical protein Q8K36_06065, partial [Alphaproteobacteria bacterium]|nr:hypothetical protein [Alphaproteobacteria bacterium]
VAQDARIYLKRKLFDQLNTAYTFELPASIVSVEEKSIREQMKNADEADQDVSDEEIKSIAERRVRLGLVIGEVAKKFEIQPTDEQIGKKLIPYLYSMGMEPQKAYEKLVKNQRFMNIIHSEALEDVTVDYMLSKATITEKTLSKEEFEKEINEILPD